MASKAEVQYEKVRAKIEGGMGVVQAIQTVAKELKLKPGSIQTAYYRIARERGQTRSLQAQQMRMQAKEITQIGGQSTAVLMDNILSALNSVVNQVRNLEEDSERLHEIEGMLSK